jgi:bile acid-coenzyme A ligase
MRSMDPRVPMGVALTHLASRDPGGVAITCGESSISWGALEGRANRWARGFLALGVRHGDLVTIALPNSIDFYVAVLACWKIGAVPQPVSGALPDVERREIVRLADPALVVGGPPLDDRPWIPEGWEAPASLPDDALEPATSPSWKVMTSGGSTGRPKLIVATEPSLIDPDGLTLGMRRDGVQLVAGPLYHQGPFIFSTRALLSGVRLVVMPHFDASTALALIERERVDWVFLVPTMLHRIWRLPEEERMARDLSSLRVVLSTGSPWPVWLKQVYLDWLGPDRIFEAYGGTESQGGTFITGHEAIEHPGSVGRPTGVGRIRVLDPDGRDVPTGDIGEIYFRPEAGPGTTYRYIGAEAKAVDGWETLGDLGYFDADGYLYLVDRRTDMIVSGGVNVYPAEVEAALDALPFVRSSAVVGLPDDDLGQRVHAILDIGGADVPDAVEQARRHVDGVLARPKRPRTYELVHLPLRDDAGKVRRRALRAARLAPPPASGE